MVVNAASQQRVLVTDGEQRAALAVVRSLGAAGYICEVTSKSGRSLAGSSRHAAQDHRIPDAADDPGRFTEAVVHLANAQAFDVVVPISEAALLALLPNRERLTACIPFTDIDTFRAVSDKPTVLATADRLGIRVPEQFVIESVEKGSHLSDALPLVLKPHASLVAGSNGSREKVGVSWAHDASQLDQALRSYPPGAFPVLAQEVITGPGIGIFVLMHGGEPVATFSHRRIREKPPSGGVSVVCQSEPMDSTLLDRTLRLLRYYQWRGPAMVEYKVDGRTGEPVLMEINGRFWGSLQLAVDAGVDFPRLLLGLASGHSPSVTTSYRNVRNRWFWGDVDNLIARMREPGLTRRSRVVAIMDWVRAFGPG